MADTVKGIAQDLEKLQDTLKTVQRTISDLTGRGLALEMAKARRELEKLEKFNKESAKKTSDHWKEAMSDAAVSMAAEMKKKMDVWATKDMPDSLGRLKGVIGGINLYSALNAENAKLAHSIEAQFGQAIPRSLQETEKEYGNLHLKLQKIAFSYGQTREAVNSTVNSLARNTVVARSNIEATTALIAATSRLRSIPMEQMTKGWVAGVKALNVEESKMSELYGRIADKAAESGVGVEKLADASMQLALSLKNQGGTWEHHLEYLSKTTTALKQLGFAEDVALEASQKVAGVFGGRSGSLGWQFAATKSGATERVMQQKIASGEFTEKSATFKQLQAILNASGHNIKTTQDLMRVAKGDSRIGAMVAGSAGFGQDIQAEWQRDRFSHVKDVGKRYMLASAITGNADIATMSAFEGAQTGVGKSAPGSAEKAAQDKEKMLNAAKETASSERSLSQTIEGLMEVLKLNTAAIIAATTVYAINAGRGLIKDLGGMSRAMRYGRVLTQRTLPRLLPRLGGQLLPRALQMGVAPVMSSVTGAFGATTLGGIGAVGAGAVATAFIAAIGAAIAGFFAGRALDKYILTPMMDGIAGIKNPVLRMFVDIGAMIINPFYAIKRFFSSDWIGDLGMKVADGFSNLFSNIGDTLSGWSDSIVEAVTGVWEMITGIFDKFMGGIADLIMGNPVVSKVLGWIGVGVDVAKGAAKTVGSAVTNVAEGYSEDSGLTSNGPKPGSGSTDDYAKKIAMATSVSELRQLRGKITGDASLTQEQKDAVLAQAQAKLAGLNTTTPGAESAGGGKQGQGKSGGPISETNAEGVQVTVGTHPTSEYNNSRRGTGTGAGGSTSTKGV